MVMALEAVRVAVGEVFQASIGTGQTWSIVRSMDDIHLGGRLLARMRTSPKQEDEWFNMMMMMMMIMIVLVWHAKKPFPD